MEEQTAEYMPEGNRSAANTAKELRKDVNTGLLGFRAEYSAITSR